MSDKVREQAYKRTQKFASILARLNSAEITDGEPSKKELTLEFNAACSAFSDLLSEDHSYVEQLHDLITTQHEGIESPADALYFAIKNWSEFIHVERSVLKAMDLPTYLIDNISNTLEDVIGFLPMLDAELNDAAHFPTFVKSLNNVQERICQAASCLEYEDSSRRHFETTIVRLDTTANIVASANLAGGVTYGDPLFTSSGVVATALWMRKIPDMVRKKFPKKDRDM